MPPFSRLALLLGSARSHHLIRRAKRACGVSLLNLCCVLREGETAMRTGYRFALAGAAVLALFVLGVRMGKQTKAAGQRDADSMSITRVLNAQQAAWNLGDVNAFLEGYWHSPELTFSGSSGVSRGWDGALALGRWHLKRDKGDIGGVFSLVWQRFPDGWKIIHDHTSAVQN